MLTHKTIRFDISKLPQVRNHGFLITAIHMIDAQYLVLTDRCRK